MSPDASPDSTPVRLLRFIDRFDRGEYWLAHEELEALWLERRRDFYKGLIHVAACLVHVGRGNWKGAATKARSGLEHLGKQPPEDCAGFDLPALRRRVGALLEHLEALVAGDADRFDETLRPALGPLFAGRVPEGLAEHEELPYRVRRHDEGYRLGRDPRARD